MIRKSKSEHYWVSIDIGTTKICVIIATLNAQGTLEVLGLGTHPSYGLKKGVVVDIDTTVDSIKKAVMQAENMSGLIVTRATVGISGGHIQSFNSHGVVPIKRRDIDQDDIDRVIEAARAIALPENREILHVLPQYFKVDGEEVVDNSLGMHGVRLEAHVHIITGNIASASNIVTCCERANITVTDIVLEHIASAEAVLTPSERALGVGMLDIGGGTSDFAIYKEGRIRYSKVLPIAGNHFTNDIAICFKIPLLASEELKRSYGSVEAIDDEQNYVVEVPLEYEDQVRFISVSSLASVLRPRAHEIFDLLLDEVLTFKLLDAMRYGLVLTGGGSLLKGIEGLAHEMFSLQTRVGIPLDRNDASLKSSVPDSLKSPIYATAYGLLLYAVRHEQEVLTSDVQGPIFTRVFKRMKSWIGDFL